MGNAKKICVTTILPRNKERSIIYSEILSDYLMYQKNKSKESTFIRYRDIVNWHLLPCLGTYPINELTSKTIESFTQQKLKNGRLDGKGGLSPKRVRDILSVFKMTLEYAQKQGWCSHVVKFALPKNTCRIINILTEPEEKRLVEYICNSCEQEQFGVLISLYMGLRIGELCALLWSDVNMDSCTLVVNKTLQRVSNSEIKGSTKVLIDSPKTPSSIRVIPIPSKLIPCFEHYKRLSSPNGYVLTGSDKYIEPSNYYKKFQRWSKQCDVPPRSFHTLRHTFATKCIHNGVDPKALSEILGHSSVNVTLSRYVHSSIDHKRNSLDKVPIYLSKEQ